MITPGVFFHFFKFLIFWVIGVKEQTMAQNDKKNMSVALHISGSMHHYCDFGTHV